MIKERVFIWLSLIQCVKTGQVTSFEESSRLEPTYSFLETGNAQHCDSEHTETSNGNLDCTMIQLYIAVTILDLCHDFSVLLY